MNDLAFFSNDFQPFLTRTTSFFVVRRITSKYRQLFHVADGRSSQIADGVPKEENFQVLELGQIFKQRASDRARMANIQKRQRAHRRQALESVVVNAFSIHVKFHDRFRKREFLHCRVGHVRRLEAQRLEIRHSRESVEAIVRDVIAFEEKRRKLLQRREGTNRFVRCRVAADVERAEVFAEIDDVEQRGVVVVGGSSFECSTK